MDALTAQKRAAGYSVMMTEAGSEHPPGLSYIIDLESQGISWAYLFEPRSCDPGICVDALNSSNTINVTWPKG